jgi:chromate reductase, NAD(P)H dehydrogenase (quinone)
MPSTPRILAFSGSSRRDSLNQKLLLAVANAARLAGGDVNVVSLNDYPMPLFNGDLEDELGLPENVSRFVDLVAQRQALLIASPEYNSQITPLLKNTLDWCTRADTNPFPGKVAAVVSASPGQFGGIRSMALARQLLTHLGCHVIPTQCILPQADKAFDATDRLQDVRAQKAVQAVAADLVRTAAALRPAT